MACLNIYALLSCTSTVASLLANKCSTRAPYKSVYSRMLRAPYSFQKFPTDTLRLGRNSYHLVFLNLQSNNFLLKAKSTFRNYCPFLGFFYFKFRIQSVEKPNFNYFHFYFFSIPIDQKVIKKVEAKKFFHFLHVCVNRTTKKYNYLTVYITI